MPLDFLKTDRDRKLASGEYVERILSCGHAVTYDVRKDNPQPGDVRLCFSCRRRGRVVGSIEHKAGEPTSEVSA